MRGESGLNHWRTLWRGDAAGGGLIWLTALAVSLSLAAVIILLFILVTRGLSHFWPAELWQMELRDESATVFLGSRMRTERVSAAQLAGTEAWESAAARERVLVHLGAGEAAGNRYAWVLSDHIAQRERPPSATVVERYSGGRVYGLLEAVSPDAVVLSLADGRSLAVPSADVIRLYQPNVMNTAAKLRLYAERLWEFLSAGPRAGNTEGGVFPAIFGTVLMVLLMSVAVTPLGVLAAIYLSEYAQQGFITRMIRIAVNNLAGVPSIVYGVFGLGFFIYTIGGAVDDWLYADRLPAPTFGTPGLLWASLTLALLTLPVVIVATEEGLARIPRALREGALGLGATRAEALWHVILPMATPAMLTGVILAIARAAGEVAPLMLVGVVKSAPGLPVSADFPWIQLEKKFMHLGFHIFDVAFHSPDVEGSRSLVYATALLLVVLVAILNFAAVALRNRLREKYRMLGI